MKWRLLDLLVLAVLGLKSLLMLLPLVWMLFTSLKPFAEVFELRFFPREPTLDDYRRLLQQTAFPRWFLNSLLVASVTTVSVLLFARLAGCTLAPLRFFGKNLVFIMILNTLMVPTEMLVILWYVMTQSGDGPTPTGASSFPTS